MAEDSQCKKPTGADGKETLDKMNDHHRPLAEWALSKLPEFDCETILDVGCGGGMLLDLLSKKYPQGGFFGIDYSPDAIHVATETCQNMVFSRCLALMVASVSKMPFPDGNFDLVTAMETYFFWPNLEKDIQEVARTIRSGGMFLIISEAYPHPDFNERNAEWVAKHNMNLVTNEEMVSMLTNSGFSAEVFTKEDCNWVAFLAKKL